jgi:glycosyltransferase involved in cell wall biosynthesis
MPALWFPEVFLSKPIWQNPKNLLNILYDGPFSADPKGGVVRYFHQISKEISHENDIFFSRKLSGRSANEIYLPPFAHFRPHRISFYMEYLWHRLCSKYVVDIVHPTEFQLSPTGSFYFKKGAKLVITIHDLIHEKFGAPGNLYSKVFRTNFYNQADGFIFVSKSTRDDFAEFYPEHFKSRPSKIIWHGCNFSFNKQNHKNRRKQFLFVGSREGYKNFTTAAQAFCKVADKYKDCKLVVVGSPPKLSELIISKNYENQISWIEFPDEERLRILYRESVALLYVSKYEGFGMPLLEAMSQGCIPIAGNHSSIPEVLGQAGIKVNCESASELSKEMEKCLVDDPETKILVKKGYDRASLFKWDKSAELHRNFYASL